jgi:hypothetical protein
MTTLGFIDNEPSVQPENSGVFSPGNGHGYFVSDGTRPKLCDPDIHGLHRIVRKAEIRDTRRERFHEPKAAIGDKFHYPPYDSGVIYRVAYIVRFTDGAKIRMKSNVNPNFPPNQPLPAMPAQRTKEREAVYLDSVWCTTHRRRLLPAQNAT